MDGAGGAAGQEVGIPHPSASKAAQAELFCRLHAFKSADSQCNILSNIDRSMALHCSLGLL